VLAAAAIVGFAFFLMELVWYRMLAPLLGGSTYTFGLILAALAQGGDEQAAVLASRLQAAHPVEAEILTARLRWRQGRAREAVEALERAFVLYRNDPWPMPILVKNAFAIVLDLGSRDAAVAARLLDALSHPFAVAVLDEERTLVRLELAARSVTRRSSRRWSPMSRGGLPSSSSAPPPTRPPAIRSPRSHAASSRSSAPGSLRPSRPASFPHPDSSRLIHRVLESLIQIHRTIGSGQWINGPIRQ
jgi:hypothetical protein